MNIIEAVKSGRRFKRKHWDKSSYLFANKNSSLGTISRETGQIIFLESDILANDWEIEPEVIEFECKWVTIVDVNGAWPFPSDREHRRTLNKLVGKRTRVRIEVL